MTVALVDSTKFPQRSVGNGVTTVFPFQYKILAKGDIKVYVAGILKTVDLDYSVTGFNSDAGGNITFLLGAPANGASVIILRSMAQKRTTDYQQLGDFLSPVVNPDFDNAVLLIQDLAEAVSRALQSSVLDPLTSTTIDKTSFLGQYLTVNGSGAIAPASGTGNDTALRADLASTTIGKGNSLVAFAKTPAESTALVTVADPTVPNHLFAGVIWVDRYVVNTTPGTTDMGPALQAAINVALAALGTGKQGIPIRFRAGAYSIATAPTFGGATINILPLDIGGVGVGTQLINNCAASTSALFPMAGKNGWYLHDFLMCGNSVHKNDGIQINTVGGAESIEWRVERVTSMMAGRGIVVADTNTASIIGFRHWPGNNPDLIVAQAVTTSDISHGIHMTGNFAHNLTITDPVCQGNSQYGSGNYRGILMDCTNSNGVTINGSPLGQTLSGLNNDISFDIAPTNQATNLTLQGVYCEGATVRLSNVVNSLIGPFANGGLGGNLRLENTCRFNVFVGMQPAIIDIMDTSGASQGNAFVGCVPQGAAAYVNTTPYSKGNYVLSGGINYRYINAATTTGNVPPNATFWTAMPARLFDGNEGNNLSSIPNIFIGSAALGGNANSGVLGYKRRALLTYAATMALDYMGTSHNVVRVTNAVAMTFSAILNPRNGQEIEVTIRNESGGAMGVITWPVTVGGWVNPANGFNRTVCFYYDSDFIGTRVKWVGTVDQPN